jgi:REP element-mobilizing transposase RayT
LAVSPPSDRIFDMNREKFANEEMYHIFNRGVDKRIIFSDKKDLDRFFQSMIIFNSVKPIGSLYEQSFLKEKEKSKPLVKFIAYNLLPNHFHFILEQVVEGGISEFLKRLLGGYSWYFNKKNKRSGSLFQGTFKSRHIDSNEYLLHVSAYVNLNDIISLFNTLGGETAKLRKSSWDEYVNQNKVNEKICFGKDIILEQFNSIEDYKEFAYSSLEDIRENKKEYKDLE